MAVFKRFKEESLTRHYIVGLGKLRLERGGNPGKKIIIGDTPTPNIAIPK